MVAECSLESEAERRKKDEIGRGVFGVESW